MGCYGSLDSFEMFYFRCLDSIDSFKGCFLGGWTVLTFLRLVILYVCTVLTELTVSRVCVLGVGTVLTVMTVFTVLR